MLIIESRIPAGTWRKYNVASTSMQRHVDATSWRCIDVEATLYLRHVPAGMFIFSYAYVHMTSVVTPQLFFAFKREYPIFLSDINF